MALTSKAKQQLKGQAHKLKPVILVGNHGLTEAVKKETDRALRDHELIKVRITTLDRELRKQLFVDLCESLQAELLQTIGMVGVVYRKNTDSEE